MKSILLTLLCTINLAISYVLHFILLTLEQYQIIAIAMIRREIKANETTNLQTLSFKDAFGERINCRRSQ